ncbi:dTDP-4-dehydrorhamnose reductase [Sphaerotilus microaerophilus]|uniref:dTDP-4-dehydrorhamnose reductase n=1 Tax=Sphaerotilus microaerophilus TaxID=2914710 RepID=A0ABN6PIX0_9BURK|nr:dTDP-4-dehydrorhamnose reductase [Sphaerotilus sp. FB-5]BDI04333.1 dTDP-4-dehydrorhamnose reductase [Sphaerotilus sp. FB-5]
MSMKKILLLGKGGQVGWELQRALAPLGEVIALDRDSRPLGADFSRPDAITDLLALLQPDVIVNAAAHTAVDRAESEPELARLINATSVDRLARHAARTGAVLVHYSTDYVFDGSGDAPRDEAAPTGPLSVYGQTKLEGEDCIRASGCRHLILRTSWVYAARGGNFARTMLRLAGERERLTVIDDQIGAPTGADLLADVTAHALCQLALEPALSGTYHAVAGGETSWHGYASHVIDFARRHGQALQATQIDAVATTAFPTPARRPLNSRLDTRRLQAAFDLVLPPWQQGVDRMLHEVLGV